MNWLQSLLFLAISVMGTLLYFSYTIDTKFSEPKSGYIVTLVLFIVMFICSFVFRIGKPDQDKN